MKLRSKDTAKKALQQGRTRDGPMEPIDFYRFSEEIYWPGMKAAQPRSIWLDAGRKPSSLGFSGGADMVLRDRVAIVTGGSSGIGRGISIELAREGARVVVADVSEDPKRGRYHEKDARSPTVAEIAGLGGEAGFIKADISNEEAVRGLVEKAADRFGGLDILVNNAGIYIPGNSQELSVTDWDRIIALNLRGVFLTTKLSVPHLKGSKAGRIINIGSVHAFGGGGGPAYGSAKAGLVNLTRDAAVELGSANITVNAICPGYIETAIQDYLTPEQIEECRRRTPLPRLGLPRDIGRVCVFMASEDASWITGIALPVDGGWMARV